ncbi:hypothetical protein HY480_01085 [Candidatus Uhrbacteria bacterium]|nr:hypothetical protein [Candidatus Uhrbacteria bacterium]
MDRKQPQQEYSPRHARIAVAVASSVAITTVAAIQVFVSVVASRRGPVFGDKAFACVAVAMYLTGLVYARRHQSIHLALAAPCFAGAGAIAFAVALRTLGAQEGTFLRSAVALLCMLGACGCTVAALAAVHELGHTGAGMVRFLLVSAISIAFTLWVQNPAPALVAAVIVWLMYRHMPALPPDRKLRKHAAEV